MRRIGELDLPDRLAPFVPRWATQLGFALVCFGAVEILRYLNNLFAPGASIFALVFPAIMVATLFARWASGAMTAVLTIGYTSFGVFLPSRTSPHPLAAVVAIAIAAAITVALAETFRRAARQATGERDREIADRDLFLAEFDHRVKNNFTIVAGLLDMQRRRAPDPATAAALETALARIDSIARAHRHLYRGGQPGLVDMTDYLGGLCAALAEALSLRGAIRLDCAIEPCAIERDRAVSIGLVINELVTNAAKHAFAGRESGVIAVALSARPGGWKLSVADDGIGIADAAGPSTDGGLGARLIDAFARQARGELTVKSDASGTIATLLLDR